MSRSLYIFFIGIKSVSYLDGESFEYYRDHFQLSESAIIVAKQEWSLEDYIALEREADFFKNW